MKTGVASTTNGKRIAWNSLLNLLGQIIPMLVAVFAIRFLVNALDAERFGLLTLVWAVIGYFSLFDFGLGRALTQLIASRLHDHHDQDLPDQVNSSLLLMLLLGCLGGFVLTLGAPLIVRHLLHISTELQTETIQSIYLIALSLPLVVVTTGARGILEAQQSFGILNWIRIALGVYMFVSPVIIILFSPHLVAIVAALVLGRFAALGAHLIACKRYSPYFQPEKIRVNQLLDSDLLPLLRAGGWMTVSNLVSPVMVYLDRFLISSFVSVAAVAFYVNPYEVVTKIWMIPSAICAVLFPAFATNFSLDNGKVRTLFGQGVKAVFLLSFPLSLLIVLFSFEGLHLWLGEQYAQRSTFIAQWMAIGVLINCFAQIAFTLVQAAGRPDWTARLHLIELPVYLVIFFVGVKWYGINGAVIAWVVRVTLDLILLLIISARILPNLYSEMKSTLLFFGLSVIALIACINVQNLWAKVVLLFGLFLLLVISAWVKMFSPQEQALLLQYLGRRKMGNAE